MYLHQRPTTHNILCVVATPGCQKFHMSCSVQLYAYVEKILTPYVPTLATYKTWHSMCRCHTRVSQISNVMLCTHIQVSHVMLCTHICTYTTDLQDVAFYVSLPHQGVKNFSWHVMYTYIRNQHIYRNCTLPQHIYRNF